MKWKKISPEKAAAQTTPDIITELSGIDSGHRISSKYAAAEILREGRFLFDIVLENALLDRGNTSVRCAEACERAARLRPELAQKNRKKIVGAVLKHPGGDLKYFLCGLLINVNVQKADSVKCSAVIKNWLADEREKGPRACYLEAIASLAAGNPALVPGAEELVGAALQSRVPSYSARARQIVMRLKKNTVKK